MRTACDHTTKKACGYQCHALAVHRPTKSTAPLVRSTFGIQSEVCSGAFCGNSQRVKPVGCFSRGAPSLMFGGILYMILTYFTQNTKTIR